jgi:NAD(P)-dependent dehydrogenase (short-subunit alcohol dehydrogenase family)
MSNTTKIDVLANKRALVVGGTGNVGFFLVDGLLRAGAQVTIPTRSKEKLERLVSRLAEPLRARVEPVFVDIGTVEGARELGRHVSGSGIALHAVLAAPASWHQTQSMLAAGFDDFKSVIETRLYPHFLAAETLLPLIEDDGAYVTINGPVAFAGLPQPGAGSIAVASVAQNKLVQALAAETGGHPRVNDVVMWAYLGPNGTRSGSPLQGEQVGDFVAALVSPLGASVHGQTLHLKSPAQVANALAGQFSS